MEIRIYRWDRYFSVALVLMVLALAGPILEAPALRMFSNDITAGVLSARGATLPPRMVGSLVAGAVNTCLAIAAFVVALIHYLRSRKVSAAAGYTAARPGALPLVATVIFGVIALALSARLLWTIFWVAVFSNATFSF